MDVLWIDSNDHNKETIRQIAQKIIFRGNCNTPGCNHTSCRVWDRGCSVVNMKLACQSQSHKKSSYWAQLAGFIQPERKGRPDRSLLASHTTERRVNTQKLKKPSPSACHNLILADVLWNDDQILSRQGAWSNGREWTRQTGGVKIICKDNGSPALLLFYLRANVQDRAGGGGACVFCLCRTIGKQSLLTYCKTEIWDATETRRERRKKHVTRSPYWSVAPRRTRTDAGTHAQKV